MATLPPDHSENPGSDPSARDSVGAAFVAQGRGHELFADPEPVYDHDPMIDEALEDEDEFDPEHDGIIRAKGTMDGATTLPEAAARLRTFAVYLETMEAEGWQLTAPVNDDYGYIHKAATSSDSQLG